PHNKSSMHEPTVSYHEFNPYCGDDVTIYLKIEKNIIKDAKFEGRGCAINTSSASMLTDYIKGKSIDEIKKIGFKKMVEIIGIDPGPSRLKCMMLPIKAVQEAIEKKEKDRQ
ncbi:MAG: iron-sulfur cluster assembly scaffold protein, partial [Candidatus Marsarchaeota archaeon]|nr:iron-sulfur cluster assembly scaffold protein [Candidatus Marsarchaeota archaeon]